MISLWHSPRTASARNLFVLAFVLWGCCIIPLSASFVLQRSIIQFSLNNPLQTTCRHSKTKCWGKYSRHTPKKTKIDKSDIVSYERSLCDEKGYSYILGSDETGRGSIAGPVLTASCCILTLQDPETNTIIDPSELPTANLLPPSKTLIRDSKQLSSDQREQIYRAIVENPHIYAFSTAQRSNTEIDSTGNILTSTMECFVESIEDLAHTQVLPHAASHQANDSETSNSSKCYSIVDGKKAPKLSTVNFPCRPMVQADQQVYTVALASIIAKVTLDRMFLKWHQDYPQYGFDQNLGYATKEHIEAIHQHGPCPLHRMSTKSLKGR